MHLVDAHRPGVRVAPGADLSRDIAITSSFHPDADTHIENVRYGHGSDAMGLLTTLLAPPRTGHAPRWAKLLAELKVETELAKLMLQKAATLYDAGEEFAAAEAANMAKFAGGEAGAKAVDRAIHSLGGNGLTTEYGLAQMLVASRLFRIAPVSREMVLNFVAQTSLGLPKSY